MRALAEFGTPGSGLQLPLESTWATFIVGKPLRMVDPPTLEQLKPTCAPGLKVRWTPGQVEGCAVLCWELTCVLAAGSEEEQQAEKPKAF